MTLENYATNLTDTRTYRALQNSLFLAIGGATVCMLLAALTAWVTTKTKAAGRGVIEALTFIPWAFPGTALAIGLLWTYVYIPLPIYGTLWILMIAYITRFLPYGLRTMTSTIVQLHDDLQQASMVCGASFLTTFRRILLPLVAAWIHRRLDSFGVDLFARVQHLGISLFAGIRALGTVALSFLRRRQFGADVFAGVGRERGLHDANLDRPQDRQSRRRLSGH